MKLFWVLSIAIERGATPMAAQISWYLTGKHRQIENFFRKLYRSTFHNHDEPRVSFLYLRSLEDTTFQEVRVTSDAPAGYQLLHARSSASESTTCRQL
ncbi:hypothetical protein BJ165DRAFT_1488749 [Panaeolus papilionaceus]|nr:hypothetical protein BJ165DRAFT_1488749 [Panaeolus papilionaceus]